MQQYIIVGVIVAALIAAVMMTKKEQENRELDKIIEATVPDRPVTTRPVGQVNPHIAPPRPRYDPIKSDIKNQIQADLKDHIKKGSVKYSTSG